VEAVLADPGAQRIGIIATRGTVRSHAYQHALALRRTGLIIHATPAPLLVPLVEEDWLDHPATHAALHTYLDPMLDRGIDTLMLACTHYPLLIPVLKAFLPDGVRLVDSATTCAELVKSRLTELELVSEKADPGSLQIHLTDLSDQFEDLSRRFLSRSPGRIQRVSL
jgi:glutamate racemase